MASSAYRRLLRDFKKVTANDAPEGISAAPVGDDLFQWTAIVFGPADTPWEGGVWKLDMAFPPEYPDKPPTVRFRNEVFHPNVFPDGQICLDLLRATGAAAGWSPSYDVCAILVAIQSLLADPDTHATPEGGANPDAEGLFVRDRHQYNARVKALVEKQLDEDDADMGCLSAVP
mmetsp:Transcript_102983/g.268858  ORF Transcript_102983/g.268858 Transcript_102983/m.268858 type:complete len:174 (+) Transcript_102983:108-629(+)